jgi:hypothetical protein
MFNFDHTGEETFNISVHIFGLVLQEFFSVLLPFFLFCEHISLT